MKTRFLLTAVAALMLTFGAQAQDVNSVIDNYNKAVELIGAKNYADAITALNQAIEDGKEVGPDATEYVTSAQKALPVCYLNLGRASAQAQNWDAAVENLNKAVELGELYGDTKTSRNASGMIAQVFTAQGASAFNSQDYAKAAEIFAKGYEADPTNTALGLNLAMSYGELGDTTNSFRIYREIIALEDRHSKYKEPAETAREKLGYYMTIDVSKAIEAKDFNTAYSLMDNILASDPENAVVNMMYVQTAVNQKNWDRVIAKGEAAAAAQSSADLKSDVYYFLGAAYQNKDNKAKALEAYRKVTGGSYASSAKEQITELNK